MNPQELEPQSAKAALQKGYENVPTYRGANDNAVGVKQVMSAATHWDHRAIL